eukprot:COSAG01_NODE_2234_length_8097_cov_5.001500_7_plen_175_part_00
MVDQSIRCLLEVIPGRLFCVQGLYFAESASKSNQYVHSGSCPMVGAMPRDASKRAKWNRDCQCKQKDTACMLLCRTTLGDCLIEHKFRGNNPGQYWCVDAMIILSGGWACRRNRRNVPASGISADVSQTSQAAECTTPWWVRAGATLHRQRSSSGSTSSTRASRSTQSTTAAAA